MRTTVLLAPQARKVTVKKRTAALRRRIDCSWLTRARTNASEGASPQTGELSDFSEGRTPPDYGEVYLAHLRDVLEGENRRLTSILSRAESLTRTTLTALTILVAAIALCSRSGVLDDIHMATWIMFIVALVFDVAAVGMSAATQVKSMVQSATSLETVDDMSSPEWFEHRAVNARFNVANRLRESIATIRPIIESKGLKLDIALSFGFAFIVALLGSVATELMIRTW